MVARKFKMTHVAYIIAALELNDRRVFGKVLRME